MEAIRQPMGWGNKTMEEMVTSAVVQEAVSGAVSFVFSNRSEKASQEELMERLEMAHIRLNLALDRTRMMPITIMALFCLKKKLMDVSKECGDLLSRARGHQKMVPSLRRKIMHTVLPSFIVPSQDVLSTSAIGRFERFVEEADRFVRDVESGCSLSHYRFFNPLTRHLLEGKVLHYHKVRGSQTWCLCLRSVYMEEYGIVACLGFGYKDCKAPLNTFELVLAVRLYESTDMVRVATKCLQSLGPHFKPLAEVAMGELTQVPTQDVSYRNSVGSVWSVDIAKATTDLSPDPFCCIGNGLNKPWTKDIISSELAGRFPQDVIVVRFRCRFSASEHCSQSLTDEARTNTIKAWPPLEISVLFAPHIHCYGLQEDSILDQIEEGIRTEAIDYFISHPDMTEYSVSWLSAHGCAGLSVSKPMTETRRASKRRR